MQRKWQELYQNHPAPTTKAAVYEVELLGLVISPPGEKESEYLANSVLQTAAIEIHFPPETYGVLRGQLHDWKKGKIGKDTDKNIKGH